MVIVRVIAIIRLVACMAKLPLILQWFASRPRLRDSDLVMSGIDVDSSSLDLESQAQSLPDRLRSLARASRCLDKAEIDEVVILGEGVCVIRR